MSISPVVLTYLRAAGVAYRNRRRTRQAGIATPVSCHSFRTTGITSFLANGSSLEAAQRMIGHASPKTTKLYGRTLLAAGAGHG